MRLRSFNYELDRQSWNEFVSAQPNATFFHLAEWHQVISKAYGFVELCYQILEEDGAIRAILPACIVRRPFAGKALISNPFSVSAGPLYDDKQDQSALSMRLFEELKALANHKEIDYIELRDIKEPLQESWTRTSAFVNFEKHLSRDHETNFSQIPNRQRAVIRKAENHSLELDLHQDLDRFLKVYAVSLRNLGTPIYPNAYFMALVECFKEDIVMASVRRGSSDLTTVLCFRYANRLMPYYGGGIVTARNYHAYPWMYWQLMKFGVENAMPVFDFGRSPDQSGAYAFKKNLGFMPRSMAYDYLPLGGNIPDLTPSSNVAKPLIQIWQKLPVAITRMVGPFGAIYAI